MFNQYHSSFNLKVNFCNVNSMFNKINLISHYLKHHQIDLLFITESWLSDKISDSMICPDGYGVIRHDRLVKRGGGVCLLYKKGLKIQQIHPNCNSLLYSKTDFEIVCVDLFNLKSKIKRSSKPDIRIK